MRCSSVHILDRFLKIAPRRPSARAFFIHPATVAAASDALSKHLQSAASRPRPIPAICKPGPMEPHRCRGIEPPQLGAHGRLVVVRPCRVDISNWQEQRAHGICRRDCLRKPSRCGGATSLRFRVKNVAHRPCASDYCCSLPEVRVGELRRWPNSERVSAESSCTGDVLSTRRVLSPGSFQPATDQRG